MTARLYIGLMSGTSLDGIDAVLVEFDRDGLRLLGHLTQPFSPEQREQLLSLTQPGPGEIDRLGVADIDFAHQQAQAVNALLTETGIPAERVAAIGSHGQTIRHRPEASHPFTLQIGDPNTLAERTGITVVADLRRRDIAAGGQGAPLVPAFHADRFRTQDQDRVILNIGGIANITLLPGAPDQTVSGFDTGPGNVLMDAWIHQQRGLPLDRDGAWASEGSPIPDLLGRLLDTPYLRQPPPKSTGRELFHPQWLHDKLKGQSGRPEDVQATLLEFSALTIAGAIADQPLEDPEIYLCGGGAHNGALRERLAGLLPRSSLQTTRSLGLDPDWVEATAFAWLAKRCLERQPGNLPAVTGASGERILGGIYPA